VINTLTDAQIQHRVIWERDRWAQQTLCLIRIITWVATLLSIED